MQLHTVEAYLIEPLKAYFEKEPKDGAEAFMVEKLAGTDPRVLEAAVEWIKGHRQSQSSFPSPKECFAAIKEVEINARQESFQAQPEGATYGEKLKKWVEAGGRAHVITKGTFEWREWEIYFLATGNKVQYPLMRSKDSWTVPTQVPKAFNHHYDWHAGSKLLEQREASDAILDVPERRAWVIQEMKRLRF